MEVAYKDPEEHVKEALQSFTGVQYTYNPGSGKLFLSGHVLTSVDYQEMRYNLSLIPAISSTDDNVIIDELVWKSMTDVLNANAQWRGVSIAAPKPGQFIIHGYVQTSEDAGLLWDYLNTNFPYPDRLQNQVVVEENLNMQILSMLQSKGFNGVAFALIVGDLVLSGRYSEKEESEYKDLVADLNKLPGIQSVKDFAVPSLPSAARVNLTEQYKVTGSSMEGNHGFSAIINGRIFTIGDILDGMKISAIEPSEILLEKDGVKYKIDYTR
jgi:type III secretion system YscD/HrpQ family protein